MRLEKRSVLVFFFLYLHADQFSNKKEEEERKKERKYQMTVSTWWKLLVS